MKNTLIIYHSKYGQTRKIAKRISDVLTSQGLEVELVHIDRADEIQTLEPYDVILLGAPIYVTAHSKNSWPNSFANSKCIWTGNQPVFFP